MPQPADNPESGVVQSPKSPAWQAFPPFWEGALTHASGGHVPEGDDTLCKPPGDKT